MIKYFLVLTFILSFASHALISDEEKAARERIFKQYAKPKVAEPEPVIEKVSEPEKVSAVKNTKSTVTPTDLDSEDITNAAPVDPKKIEEITKSLNGAEGLNSGFLGKMMNAQMKEAAAKMMKSNPFKAMSNEQIKSMITGSLKPDSPVAKFFNNNPTVTNCLIAWIKDEKALPSFISILNQPQKMKYLGYCVLGLFIFAFIVNLKNGGKSLLKRLALKIFLIFFTSTLNFALFYYFFKKELDPTIDVISKFI